MGSDLEVVENHESGSVGDTRGNWRKVAENYSQFEPVGHENVARWAQPARLPAGCALPHQTTS